MRDVAVIFLLAFVKHLQAAKVVMDMQESLVRRLLQTRSLFPTELRISVLGKRPLANVGCEGFLPGTFSRQGDAADGNAKHSVGRRLSKTQKRKAKKAQKEKEALLKKVGLWDGPPERDPDELKTDHISDVKNLMKRVMSRRKSMGLRKSMGHLGSRPWPAKPQRRKERRQQAKERPKKDTDMKEWLREQVDEIKAEHTGPFAPGMAELHKV
eukprot:gnl/TRDRNA2_/TRDRNA2_89969_c0_seq1.p1 gnl/TRDRNA2_/TRDRNA2_89969_c0~~gnl/TRDRNA2_/TRDRNA2_89969_c0_seq1.p1  ORF type:complete len:212 (+),score=50.87 gnl/TRDRNA2_/TRDRNA2_89969_c0_seq1:95-730(+)